jgi:hypothetical protein
MARNALQLSIISAQHFCTRRATSKDGFSSSAPMQLSCLIISYLLIPKHMFGL